MSERAAAAIAALRATLAELEAVVGEIGAADWRRESAAERWPVGLVAFHIARGFQRQAEFVEEAQQGHGPHLFNWGQTHALNAAVAEAHPSPARDDVLALARSSVARIATALGAMDDAALSRAAFVFEDRQRDAVWVAGRLATGHARTHLESIAGTIAGR
ncbi:MAG TPA: maleylpyruvate isomerase N-terminal domain-containing protein [Candidatus Limnocylindria bacterium]|nr:maleylpyruvate isomerase N-terminal domain-containing protein [Candidatus Limnocylindria bacterium]